MSKEITGNPPHVGFLDALRGCAISGVFLIHFCHYQEINVPKFLQFVGSGVTLFYVLSSYCLMLSLGRKNCRVVWKHYFYRRLFRIAPAFYCGVLIWLVIGELQGRKTEIAKILSSILFVNGYVPGHIHSSIPHGWSIAVETGFYLILPLIFLGIRSLFSSLALFVVVTPICMIGSWAFPSIMQKWAPGIDGAKVIEHSVYWLPAQLPIFLAGIVAYFVTHGTCSMSQWMRDLVGRSPGWVWMGLCSVAFVYGYLPARVGPICIAVGFALLVIWLADHPRSYLDNKMMRGLGIISFSAYLFHQIGIDLSVPPPTERQN